MIDILITLVVLAAAIFALKAMLNDDRKVMRRNTREYLDEYVRDKKPRQR